MSLCLWGLVRLTGRRSEERESVLKIKEALPDGKLPVGFVQEVRAEGIKQGASASRSLRLSVLTPAAAASKFEAIKISDAGLERMPPTVREERLMRLAGIEVDPRREVERTRAVLAKKLATNPALATLVRGKFKEQL
jgi:hypothetical protein